MPRLALADRMPYVQDFSDAQIKGIGVLELLAAFGLIVPPLLHVATFLTPLAAVGLVPLMGGAAATHLRRHEPQMVATNGILLILAAVVAIGRFGPYPF
jgi:DoxX-like protein